MTNSLQNQMLKSYIIPKFEMDDLLDTKVQHWINLFGQKGLFTLQERVLYILEINKSVFQEGNNYTREIHELLQDSILQKGSSNTLEIEPQEYYQEFLTIHMLRTDPTLHHIIFKNKHLGGHPKHKDNLTNIGRGKHTSFHELLNQKNLYPHQQLSKFLFFEKSTIPQTFFTSVQTLEKIYHNQFQKDPFSIYKQEVFQENFKRLNF